MGELNFHRRGTGEPLLLVHGIGSRWQVWEPVLDRVAAEREVIAVDLPGYGSSPAPPPGTPSGIEALADALEHFLEEQGLDMPHAAGNSLGGWLALELARRGRVRSATGLSPGGFWTDREIAFARSSLRMSVRGARALAPQAEAATRTAAGRTALFWQVVGHPWRIPPQDAADSLRDLAGAPRFDADLEALSRQRFGRGDGISVPVTIAWGTRDWLLIPRQGPRTVRMIPGARLVPLPGCGHVPTYDDPELVARVLLEGSRSVTAPERAGAGAAA